MTKVISIHHYTDVLHRLCLVMSLGLSACVDGG